jgi:hypothetical protein
MDLARAASDDIPRIVDMVECLRSAINGPIAVDRGWTGAQIARLIANPMSCVFVTARGFIAGSVVSTVISPQLIATEHGWYAADGSGLRLLRAYEAWALGCGASVVQVSTGPAGLDLTRLGYRAAEMAWVK